MFYGILLFLLVDVKLVYVVLLFFSYSEVGYLRFSISCFDATCNMFDGLSQRTMTHNVRTRFSISCFDDARNLFDGLQQRTMARNVLTRFCISCFDDACTCLMVVATSHVPKCPNQ